MLADEDRRFWQSLESGNLSPDDFDHRGHLRAAWVVLSEEGLENGGPRFLAALKRYAEGLGVGEKFHLTVSVALLCILAETIRTRPEASFPTLLAACPDLLGDAKSLLYRYYSPERLAEDRARREWLAPDREPLPVFLPNLGVSP